MHALPPDFTILAIESSCDETAAAIVRGGQGIVANVVASQIDEHRRYGGIVPEVASRQHILAITPVVEEALAQLPGGWEQIHAVAATYGPGLAGGLLTGLNPAKTIAWSRDLPFVGVNHLEAHIYANWLRDGGWGIGDGKSPSPSAISQPPSRVPTFPLIALVVSGGHTLLALLEGHGVYRLPGQTRDDAAGEAFDKAARIMGLGFPGGPAIQRAAEQAPGGVTLPRAWLRDSYDFSFSGLKTAVLHQVQGRQNREAKLPGGRRQETGDRRQERQPHPPSITPPCAALVPHPPSTDKYMAQLAYAFQES